MNTFRQDIQREDYFSRIVRAVFAVSDRRPYYDQTEIEVLTNGDDPDRCPNSSYHHAWRREMEQGDPEYAWVYTCGCGARMTQHWKRMPSLLRVVVGQ